MKVFGIGIHKTGTSTLAECFRVLGYRLCPEDIAYITNDSAARGDYRHCLRIARDYEAFEDSPWNFFNLYKVLDAVFPGSKFILTVRDSKSWWRFMLRWISLTNGSSDATIFAALTIQPRLENEEKVLATYERVNSEVIAYFAGRPDDLLVVNWEAGDGWDRLCGFLDRPIPDLPFPHKLRYDPERQVYVDGGPSSTAGPGAIP